MTTTTQRRGMKYALPLREHFDAKLVLPPNMTRSEAERICKFIMALAIEPAANAPKEEADSE